MRVLVTGAAGMIGSALTSALLDAGYEVVALDRREGTDSRAINVVADLADKESLLHIVEEQQVDRVIHLAALAHTAGEDDLSYDRYYHVNVTCARNVFEAAQGRPVLFISTVDVYGFTKGIVSTDTALHPVTDYGKTKALAEESCKEICDAYTIFRLSPVYTKEIKRDIQKRYYLKYPNIAYRIGKGSEYEVLNIDKAISEMVSWCGETTDNRIRIIKDDHLLQTETCIQQEKAEGRAKFVFVVPQWLLNFGFAVLKFVFGENKYTYLINKAVHPLRTE